MASLLAASAPLKGAWAAHRGSPRRQNLLLARAAVRQGLGGGQSGLEPPEGAVGPLAALPATLPP